MDARVPDRLVVAVVQVEDAGPLVEALTGDGFGGTRIDTHGGFLRRENAVVLVATAEERLTTLFRHVRATCRHRIVPWVPPMLDSMVATPTLPIDVEVGGAVMFVLPIERVAYLGLPSSNVEKGELHEAAAVGA